MKKVLLCALLALPLSLLLAQPTPHPVKLYSSGADVSAMIAKAKASGGNLNILIANDEGYPVMMEYPHQADPGLHPSHPVRTGGSAGRQLRAGDRRQDRQWRDRGRHVRARSARAITS